LYQGGCSARAKKGMRRNHEFETFVKRLTGNIKIAIRRHKYNGFTVIHYKDMY
jgi:hypothetical protein